MQFADHIAQQAEHSTSADSTRSAAAFEPSRTSSISWRATKTY